METVRKMEDLAQMRNVDIRTVDREGLVDIGTVHIDSTLPREERFADFLQQIRNPYCYRCGKIVVKVSFSDTDATLEDRLEHYLATL